MRWFTFFDGGEASSWYLCLLLNLLDSFILCVSNIQTKYERMSSILSAKLRIYFSPNHGAAWLNLIPREKWVSMWNFNLNQWPLSHFLLEPQTSGYGGAAGKVGGIDKVSVVYLQPWISERNIKQQRLSMTSSRGIKCILHHCGASLLWMFCYSLRKCRMPLR